MTVESREVMADGSIVVVCSASGESFKAGGMSRSLLN